MKLLFISAAMAVFAAAPGAVASSSSRGVESYDSEPSAPSFDVYPQDSDSSKDGLMDSEPVDNNNMFIALENPNNPNCDGIGPNTCENRVACIWMCDTFRGSDRDLGCCEYKADQRRTPTRRPQRNPTRRPTRRPTGSSNRDPSFDSGLDAGRTEANRLWRNAGNRCSSAWGGFQNDVNRQIRTKGWNRNDGDWRSNAFNRGARAGMEEVVVEKEKECFRDSADECVDLGNAAAREIAYAFCPRGFGTTASGERPQWRRNCRDAAVDQCRGQVSGEVRDECGGGFSTNELRTLQNKCRNKVLTMIGDRSED
ncbi:hypothetical protein QTG54_006150 [Skeletonema marinoi]|uniref:Uncharacterized protein n=1 Tax=Skeletonema marinoi TaxID=267567 RepID=A0AAD8YBQ1_9STRA|nr:hypothetical protein QTG54_006150 [Skeletonema marinoi]